MTRLLTLCLVVGAIIGLGAQAPNTNRPDPRTVRLRGDRFSPLTYDEMTPAQKTMIEHLIAGPRGGTTEGPFNVQLRSPEIGWNLMTQRVRLLTCRRKPRPIARSKCPKRPPLFPTTTISSALTGLAPRT